MSGAHTGRVAIVTGAAQGIGRAIAERLAAEGANLMLADANGDVLKKAVDIVAGAGKVDIITHVGDLAQEDVVNAMVDATLKRWGKVDILVNNAGGGVIKPFLDHTPETLRLTIDRNLWTAIWCCRAVLPHMKAAKYGRIVSIGADSVRNGLWDHAAYNAAKGGVHGLTAGLAREFALDGITVNAVAPCAVATPQLEAFMNKGIALIEKFIGVIPMGRAGDMREIASAVSYFASTEASFVTGQVVSVNGGSTML
ncbi:MAG: 2,3-dihydroxy-2,3-dihydro-p-cumate dehydrogenase [Alphaproteobacteria bacterium]|nr:D519 [uncultured bacterium]MCK9992413.1 2,3-dihydroxy-2,3-dihydro-p-cumate dehydrogenase [Alphaproteobacteria bacterium]